MWTRSHSRWRASRRPVCPIRSRRRRSTWVPSPTRWSKLQSPLRSADGNSAASSSSRSARCSSPASLAWLRSGRCSQRMRWRRGAGRCPPRGVPSRLGGLAALELNPLRLYLGPLRKRQRQHAILELRTHVLRVDSIWQREGPGERAVVSLIGEVPLVLVPPLVVALSGDAEAVAGERHFQILFFQAWHIGLEDERVARLLHLERGNPRSGAGDRFDVAERIPAKHFAHQVKRIPRSAPLARHFTRLIPTNDAFHLGPPFCTPTT